MRFRMHSVLAATALILSGCSGPSRYSSFASTTHITSEPTAHPAVTNAPHISSIEIDFDYIRMSGQASNQVALWVEDAEGQLIRTIYVSDFSARRRGYQYRNDALNHWVDKADPDQMPDTAIDAFTGATLQSGHQAFNWDLKDDSGNAVPVGEYVIRLEGTLFWSSNVLYSGTVNLDEAGTSEIDAQKVRSEPDNTTNESMLENIAIKAVRD